MASALLEGHYAQRVEVDLCRACHLLWFDDTESVRLSGLGWITLLREMNATPPQAIAEIASPLACVRCGGACAPIRNLSRFGRSVGHECAKGHGYFQTFGQLLAERGLVRALGARDRRALQQERRALACLNCGAGLPESTTRDTCAYCASPLLVFDVQRLLASVMVRHGLALPEDAGRPIAWACRACGDAVDPTRMTGCERCGHVVVAPSLGDAMPWLDVLEPQLLAMRPRTPRPHGERLRERSDFRGTALHRLVFQWFGYADVARGLDTDPARRETVTRRRQLRAGEPFDWHFVGGLAAVVGTLLGLAWLIWHR
jgi:DNA-directed RNA polymerase subunit RPC12/RpoP